MCGIVGIVTKGSAPDRVKKIGVNLINELLEISQSRGIESAGFGVDINGQVKFVKSNISAKKMLKLPESKLLLSSSIADGIPQVIIGHARMVTNGAAELHKNNQPVSREGISVVHNGIITNEQVIERMHPELDRRSDVDTEILPLLISKKLNAGLGISEAIAEIFTEIRGAASFAALGAAKKKLVLASNTGSLYSVEASEGVFVFASEKRFLSKITRKFSQLKWHSAIKHISQGKLVLVDYDSASIDRSGSADFEHYADAQDVTNAETVSAQNIKSHKSIDQSQLQFNIDAISNLKRCTKCVLPETFPFIYFNNDGECNYCDNYAPKASIDKSDQFEEILSKYRSDKNIGDCIIALSGGRDSTYALHLISKEFNMRPVTYTYDWGMVTDIARQNMAEITGRLGVENILVSANIPQKLSYIQKNVSAWLKKPDLGIIPLFMAGDKFFFKHVNEVKRATGLELDIWSPNAYENTDFKTGFCGIPPVANKQDVDELGMGAKLTLPMYYLKQFIGNPGLFNSSMIDTLGAYWSYYFEPRNNICFTFDYLPWDETELETCLVDEYGWEVCERSGTTWRRGDGTAPFYNYIYYTVAGFTEFDTFRSNQIREGVITREYAMKKVNRENQPNPEGLEWYFNRINVDADMAVKRINQMSKLYQI